MEGVIKMYENAVKKRHWIYIEGSWVMDVVLSFPACSTDSSYLSCGHICSWGLCGTQTYVKERPVGEKHSQLQLLTLLPQLTLALPHSPPCLPPLQ